MPITSLISDLGLFDGGAALARALILAQNPQETLIDISHGVEPHHLHQAAYILESNGPDFPPKTVHMVLLDLFDQSPARVLVAPWQDHFLIAPDNGIFSLLPLPKPLELREYPSSKPLRRFGEWMQHAAELLHALRTREGLMETLPAYQALKQPQPWVPVCGDHYLEGHIIYVDRYENVVLNIRKEQFEQRHRGSRFRIQLMRQEEVLDLHNEYASVKEGEKFARFNRAGYLEIGIKKGSAASLLDLRPRRDKNLVYHSIKILFE